MMGDGPYLTAAIFCERVIEEKDKILTLVRIMDAVQITLAPGAPADFPNDKDRIPVLFDSLIALKAGKSSGDHTVRIDMISPSGKRSESEKRTLTLPSEENGAANLITHHTISIMQGGLFYFEVFVDDTLATRIPFRIDVLRAEADQSPQPRGDILDPPAGNTV